MPEILHESDADFLEIGGIKIRIDSEVADYYSRRGKKTIEPTIASFLVVKPDYEEEGEDYLLIYAASDKKITHEMLLVAGELLDVISQDFEDEERTVFGGGAVGLICGKYDHDSLDYGPVEVDPNNKQLNKQIIEKITTFLIKRYQ